MQFIYSVNLLLQLSTLDGGFGDVTYELGPFFRELTMDEIDGLDYRTINPKKIPSNFTFNAQLTSGQVIKMLGPPILRS